MSIKNLIQENYRPDINGLRAFSIIIVIINHFNKDLIPSGYLGVDIFFVISGYVITSSISKREHGTFINFLTGFYERRLKRLIPALIFFVIVTSILISFFRFYSSGPIITGFASLFGMSNVALFWISRDYFAEAALLNPFTHTWSLGVEEQFYLLFPLIIWFSGFNKKTNQGYKNLLITLSTLSLFSLISFIYLYPINQPAAYFLMPNRFWEIASGSICFLLINQNKTIKNNLESLSPFFILILMISVTFLPLSASIPATLLMVFLTFLLISSLREGKLIYSLFINKKVIYIGLISYSLYLWHWGIISISRWTIGIHWWSIPIQVFLILILSISSYRFIENPFREKNWSTSRMYSILKGVLSILISGTFIIGFIRPLRGKLFLGNHKSQVALKNYFLTNDENFCNPAQKKYRTNGNLKYAICIRKNNKENKKIIVTGDSHALSFLIGAEFVANELNLNLSYLNLGNVRNNFFKEEKNSKDFDKVSKNEKFYPDILLKSKKGDIVFVFIRMKTFWGEDLYQDSTRNQRNLDNWLSQIEDLTKYLSKKDVKLVITDPTPEFPDGKLKRCKGQNDQWFNTLNQKDCSFPLKDLSSLEGKYFNIIENFKNISNRYENLYFFESLNYLCPNQKCDYSIEGIPLYKDDNHITRFTARYIYGPKILRFLKENNLVKNNPASQSENFRKTTLD